MKNFYFLIFLFVLITVVRAKAQSGPTIGGWVENAPVSINRDNTCDTIFSFGHQGLNPTGIAFDGTYLWCNSSFSPLFIYRFDLSGQLIDSVASPTLSLASGGMEFDGTHILVCVEQDGILYKLDPVSGALVTQFNLPNTVSDPADTNNYGIAFDGTYLWHTEYSTSTAPSVLYKLDPNNGNVLKSVPLADSDLGIKFINGNLYGLAPVNALLHKIDTTNGNYLSTEQWCLGYTLGFTVANNHVWASQYKGGAVGTGRIFQFDGQFLNQINTLVPEIDFSVYPNPMSDWMHLELREIPGSKLHIDIVNVLDQHIQSLVNQEIVYVDQAFDFDLSQYAKGAYVIKVKTDKAQSFKTFLKL